MSGRPPSFPVCLRSLQPLFAFSIGLMYDPEMRKPPRRPEKVLRLQEPKPPMEQLAPLATKVSFQGSPKHKRNPERFGLGSYSGTLGDATLCDEHAGFSPDDSQYVRSWMVRGIQSGLVGDQWEQGKPRVLWAVADDGWIFEGRITNITQGQYHGYPVMPGSAIARLVYDRFSVWVEQHPKARHKAALQNCRSLYGF